MQPRETTCAGQALADRTGKRPSNRRRGLLLLALLLPLTAAGCAQKNWAPVYYGAPPNERVAEPSSVGAAPTGQALIVRPGDTLSQIAYSHGLSQSDLIALNELVPPYLLQPGQRLRLPAPRTHTVKPGDTLYYLARTYDVSVDALRRENDIWDPTGLRVGQTLRLPRTKGRLPETGSAQFASLGATPMPKPAGRATASQQPKQLASVPRTKPPTRPAAWPSPRPEAGAKSATGSAPSFGWPARGPILSSFGSKGNGMRNDGVNISLPAGSPVLAAQSGQVIYAAQGPKAFGNLVLIDHGGGWVTAYAHVASMSVRAGERVVRGQKIATVGSTGLVTAPQLHFEIRKGRKPLDPKPLLQS